MLNQFGIIYKPVKISGALGASVVPSLQEAQTLALSVAECLANPDKENSLQQQRKVWQCGTFTSWTQTTGEILNIDIILGYDYYTAETFQ